MAVRDARHGKEYDFTQYMHTRAADRGIQQAREYTQDQQNYAPHHPNSPRTQPSSFLAPGASGYGSGSRSGSGSGSSSANSYQMSIDKASKHARMQGSYYPEDPDLPASEPSSQAGVAPFGTESGYGYTCPSWQPEQVDPSVPAVPGPAFFPASHASDGHHGGSNSHTSHSQPSHGQSYPGGDSAYPTSGIIVEPPPMLEPMTMDGGFGDALPEHMGGGSGHRSKRSGSHQQGSRHGETTHRSHHQSSRHDSRPQVQSDRNRHRQGGHDDGGCCC